MLDSHLMFFGVAADLIAALVPFELFDFAQRKPSREVTSAVDQQAVG